MSDDGPLKPSRPKSSSKKSRPFEPNRMCRLRGMSPSLLYGLMSQSLQIAACRLFALDGLEQGPEVTLAEALAALALDHFEEQRRPVADGAREDLQQVSVVVAVDEDVEIVQPVEVFVDALCARSQRGVVLVGRGEKLDPALLHLADRLHDVIGVDRDVLHTRAAVVIEVF